MTDGAAAILRDVSFGYRTRVPVISRCTLRVERGRVSCLLGQNGSGKTTLMRLVAGALRPDSGSIDVAATIAYVPQSIQFAFSYAVIDVVLMGRARHVGLFNTPSRIDEEAALASLDRVGLHAFAHRPFDELSGGERQLVTLARALAAEADLLVLDEPMAALDLHHQEIVLQWIHRLAHDDGLTVLFSTHQPQHADAVADDVALMYGVDRIEVGAADAMLRPERLSELFQVEIARVSPSGALVPRWRVHDI